MQCPKCHVEMDEVRKLDVVVDSCTRCGGMWLDRGELDKIRAAAQEIRRDEGQAPSGFAVDAMRKVATEVSAAGKHHKKHKRPKSLSDLFEIFD